MYQLSSDVRTVGADHDDAARSVGEVMIERRGEPYTEPTVRLREEVVNPQPLQPGSCPRFAARGGEPDGGAVPARVHTLGHHLPPDKSVKGGSVVGTDGLSQPGLHVTRRRNLDEDAENVSARERLCHRASGPGVPGKRRPRKG